MEGLEAGKVGRADLRHAGVGKSRSRGAIVRVEARNLGLVVHGDLAYRLPDFTASRAASRRDERSRRRIVAISAAWKEMRNRRCHGRTSASNSCAACGKRG